MPNRRPQFFLLGLVVGIVFLLPGIRSKAATVPVKIQVDANTVVSRISPDFMGLGYETSAVAQTNYFSPKNAALIQLYRNLSPHGLIRIGGNISDHARYVPEGIPAVHTEKEVTIFNQTNLVDLAGFARATGWKVMWGLNLGTGSKAAAAQEAVAVSTALGTSLHSFEIGNEVDIHGGYDGKYRDYAGYYSNYLAYKAVIRSALPQAVFSGPDVAWDLAWLTNFANAETGDIQLLTHHYYRTGAMRPEATIENLLQSDAAWAGKLQTMQQVGRDKQTAFRINEVNSFYGGGKPGVSDTFASALWALDYMFQLATYGGDGINLETDINQLGWISHYSPIVHDAAGRCRARPEYYGMLAFALAGNGDLIKLNLDKSDLNLTAYATKVEQGRLWITVVNKDLSRDAALETSLPDGYTVAEAFRLTAPSVLNKDQVTFAGAAVTESGQWSPQTPEPIQASNRKARLLVPQVSAVLLRLR